MANMVVSIFDNKMSKIKIRHSGCKRYALFLFTISKELVMAYRLIIGFLFFSCSLFTEGDTSKRFMFESRTQFWSAELWLPSAMIQGIYDKADRYKLFTKTSNGLLFTIHVEPQENYFPNNAYCKQKYWVENNKKIPTINNSITEKSDPRFEQVFYAINLNYKNNRYEMENVNIFKAYRNLCLDIHVGVTPGTKKFRTTVEKIMDSFVLRDLLTNQNYPERGVIDAKG